MKKVITTLSIAVFLSAVFVSCRSHEKCAAYGKYGYSKPVIKENIKVVKP